jgi:hypothetical protein
MKSDVHCSFFTTLLLQMSRWLGDYWRLVIYHVRWKARIPSSHRNNITSQLISIEGKHDNAWFVQLQLVTRGAVYSDDDDHCILETSRPGWYSGRSKKTKKHTCAFFDVFFRCESSAIDAFSPSSSHTYWKIKFLISTHTRLRCTFFDKT